jgi:hypothetical protein
MLRLLMVCVLLTIGVAMPGCKDKGSGNAAKNFSVQEGPRPKDGPTKPPPAPPGSQGFQAGGGETTEPPPDDEDSDD